MISLFKKFKTDTTMPVIAFVSEYLEKYNLYARYQQFNKKELNKILAHDFKTRMDKFLFNHCDWKRVAERILEYENI